MAAGSASEALQCITSPCLGVVLHRVCCTRSGAERRGGGRRRRGEGKGLLHSVAQIADDWPVGMT